MKRSFLHTALVLSTIIISTSSRSVADDKFRISGGSGRGQSGQRSMQLPGMLNSRTGNTGGNGNGNSGNVGSGQAQSGGVKISNGFQGRIGTFKLPGNGTTLNQSNLNPKIAIPRTGTIGENTNREHRKVSPTIGHQKFEHLIQLPNGSKTKAVPVDLAKIQKLSLSGNPVQSQQIQGIVSGAPKHLCKHPKFPWWVSVCHSHNHTHYGCWHVHTHYWNCWTPCSWQVVQCEQLSWYVGLSCIHIPDMQAYGVQSVVNGSPAHVAGLQSGDLILTVNGQPAFDPSLVNSEVSTGRLDLQVIREGIPTPLLLTVFPRLVQTVSF